MKKIENFKIGLTELRSNKLRTSLTMLGIIFGVGAVIAMLSIGEGARQETLEQIELLGTNNIIINQKKVPKSSNNKKASFSPGLNLKDANSISLINPFVESVTPQLEYELQVRYKSEFLETKIIGTTENYPQTFNSQCYLGSFFQKPHMDNYSPVCVIGYGIKDKLFKFENPIGKKIKIGTTWFSIIGVLASKNISSAGMDKLGLRDFNGDIYVPITTMSYKIENPEKKMKTLTVSFSFLVITSLLMLLIENLLVNLL